MLVLRVDQRGEITTLELENGEYRVGRSADSEIHLTVPTVSRKHAIVRIDGERLFVRDLDSAGGTWVGATQIGEEEVELAAGDTVSFAGVRMWRQSELGDAAHTLLSTDDEVSSGLSYRLEDGFTEPAGARILDMMSSLFELLATHDEGSGLEGRGCEFVAECVQADRVVVLEDDGVGTRLRQKGHWSRHEDDQGSLRISSTLISLVHRERRSILIRDTHSDQRAEGHASFIDLDIRSAMAAPLFDNQRVRGVLYVDSRGMAKRYDDEDLQVLTAAANAIAVKRRNLELEQELRTAVRIQKAMLPRRLPTIEGYSLLAVQEMCRGVGGDLYDCLLRPDGTYLLALGDVAGKGTPAALAMGACTVLLRVLAELGGPPVDLARRLHRHLLQTLTTEQFVTMFVGELDPATGRLSWVSAGHEPALVIRASGSIERFEATAVPLGLLDPYEVEQADLKLDPGDLLAIFSDGIPEATVEGEVFFEHEKLEELLVVHRADPLAEISSAITASVADFLAGHGASDDLTLLLVRRAPA